MALEEFFNYPKTLNKLRSDPLVELTEGFCNWLVEQGFSRQAIRKHLICISHLNSHLDLRRGTRCIITENDIKTAFEAYSVECRRIGERQQYLRRMSYSVNRFLQYLSDTGALEAPRPKDVYQPVLDAYLTWMRRNQHASDGTLQVRRGSIIRFLQWLGPEATPEGLAELTAERIEGFFLGYAQGIGRAARRSMQSALRTFLRFCLRQGWTVRPLHLAVPTMRTYKLSTVPRGITDSEAQRTLQGINRKGHVGRRDYAIIQLLYTYGVRGGQIRALKLEDIDWAHDQILFKASKHGKDSLLPLTVEVGECMLDYLQNSRSPSSSPYVFLTCRAPYHPLSYSSSLSVIVERHLRSCGIESPSKGAHLFRHGFATRMLHNGQSLKDIADVLGHRHLSTTFIYTKVGFDALRQVALEWPQEVSP